MVRNNKKQKGKASSSTVEENLSTCTNSSIPVLPSAVGSPASTQSDGLATNTEFGSNAGFSGATGNAIGTNNTINFNKSYNIRLEFPNVISFFQFAAKPFAASSRNKGLDPVEIREILPFDPPSAPPSSIADMYTRSMLQCLAGYPLYNPKPLSELSEEYLLKGVNIGDVGFVRADGAFDFLFNICPSQKDLINPPNLPDGFSLGTRSVTRSLERLPHNTWRIPQSVTKTKSGEYICQGPEGAILELPEGAVEDEALNMRLFKDLAKLHGVKWYEYTLIRGRDISNGSLYLVTSFTKCSQWGIAVFDRPCNQGQGLTFVNSPLGWKGFGSSMTKAAAPNQGDIPNQCVFLRGYKIMLHQDIFNKLGKRQRAQRIRGGGGTGFMSRMRNILTGESSLTRTKSTVTKSDKVVLHTNFNLPPVHPSDLINAALLSENPDAKVALTHDDVWCDLLRDNFPELDYATLINIARSYTSTIDEYGCVSLENDASNVLDESSRPVRETETSTIQESNQDVRDERNPDVSMSAQASTTLLPCWRSVDGSPGDGDEAPHSLEDRDARNREARDSATTVSIRPAAVDHSARKTKNEDQHGILVQVEELTDTQVHRIHESKVDVDPSIISNTPFPSAPNSNEGSSTTERKQIIGGEKNFTSDLDAQIEQWGLRQAGLGYNIVAVFGSQSTGKSTLLNRLFGTNFDVMDESKRQKTTKGVWMCRAANSNILVMDVEGTDGREHGEDQEFERKLTLFSLASSEVLIVNILEHQVGLYKGANMGLLKTVFEVNLGLFGKKALEGTSGRTLLLFVVRDHVSPTPLENLQTTLTADLEQIWHSLSKPAELRDHKLSDFFDLAFISLPHKLLQPDKFEADVAQLRTRFINKDQDGFFFKPAYHKRVPADGLSFYMQSIWEQVQNNKYFDPPSQQELLAQFRCDEVSKVALSEFNEQAKSQKRPVEGGQVVEGLGAMMRTWRTEAQTKYDRETSCYHQQVYKRKRADLITAMNATLSALFVGQLKNLHKASLIAFKQQMVHGVKYEKYKFADVVAEARKFCEGMFMRGANDALIEGTDWRWQAELGLLEEEIQHVAGQFRRNETNKTIDLIERKFKSRISDPVETALKKATPDMWDGVLVVFKGALTQAEEMYTAKANSFNCTEEENTTSLAELRRRTWQALRAKIDEQVTEPSMLGKLRSYFEQRFRYEETGVPRVWEPSDDIKNVFNRAKEETLALVSLYAKISPKDPENDYEMSDDNDAGDDFDFASSKVVFLETKVHDLQTKFSRDADANYVEAERGTVAGFAQIPLARWICALLVVHSIRTFPSRLGAGINLLHYLF